MNTFLLKITSPEGDVFCGEVARLIVRGTEGELAVMAGHIPFVSAVKPCEFKMMLEDGSEKTARTSGGLLTVSKEKTLFLAEDPVWEN